ncbi:excalibur calcium-binding domain-containing protein [Mycobacterium florentinum]
MIVAPAAQADPPYANCKAAAADGRYNIPRGDPAYQQKLDRDNDGIACESH